MESREFYVVVCCIVCIERGERESEILTYPERARARSPDQYRSPPPE